MKINTCITLSIPLLLLCACKKEILSRPVDFSSASYQTLGTYDSTGKPNNLLPRDNISSEMMSYVKTTLVEKSDVSKTFPELLSKSSADFAITQSSDVFITYAYNNTVYSNALAFYTYPTGTPPTTGKDIKSITIIFPNAGAGTKLKAGDKVNIGRFEPGTSIGFVVLKGAWDATTKSLNNKVEHYLSTDILNPEVASSLKRHTVMLNYASENKTFIGFENTDRTSEKCDNDFNDIVFYSTVAPQ
jgi:Domain of unknown function (DUF4114)